MDRIELAIAVRSLARQAATYKDEALLLQAAVTLESRPSVMAVAPGNDRAVRPQRDFHDS